MEACELVAEIRKEFKGPIPRSGMTSKKFEGKMVTYLNQDQSKMIDEFALRWSTLVKFDRGALPTLKEILSGLLDFLQNKVEVTALWKKKSKDNLAEIQKNLKLAFDLISSSLPEGLIDKQLTLNGTDRTGDTNLLNTEGKATCLLLWLYSMEPPLYAYIAEVQLQSNTKDLRPLKWLGPFVKVISEILTSEVFREDKMPNGEDLLAFFPELPLGTFSSSYLLFKFSYMEQAQIDNWSQAKGLLGKSWNEELKKEVENQDVTNYVHLT